MSDAVLQIAGLSVGLTNPADPKILVQPLDLTVARGQIGEHHAFAVAAQPLRERKPDEPGAAGNQRRHRPPSRLRSARRSSRATQRAIGHSSTKKITAAAISGVGL